MRHSNHRRPFIAVHSNRDTVVAATYNSLALSRDAGSHWVEIVPPQVSVIKSLAVDENSRIWVASPQGLFRKDGETAWQKVQGDWSGPANYVTSETGTAHMFAAAGNSKASPQSEHSPRKFLLVVMVVAYGRHIFVEESGRKINRL